MILTAVWRQTEYNKYQNLVIYELLPPQLVRVDNNKFN